MKLTLLNLLIFLSSIINPTIESDKARWKPYYVDTNPATGVTDWHLPFDVSNRKDIKQLKVISIFGDHRDSY
ncbi:hypothetical protein ACXZ1K_14225 [Pedobacter sp. PWIIR3]